MSIFRLHGLLFFLISVNFLATFETVEGTENEQVSTTSSENNHSDKTVCVEGRCTVDGQHGRTNSVVSTSVSSSSVTDDMANSLPHQDSHTYGVPAEIVWPETVNPHQCPFDIPCSSLDADCIVCDFNYTCVYGNIVNVTCKAIHSKCEVMS